MLDVLIVEDSTAIRKILQRILRQTTMPIGEIWEAGDGQEALAILKEHAVSLVLSDINMPNMDGLEMLRHMAADPTLKNIPVVMITTEGSQASVLKAAEAGAVGYIRKPFNPQQITEKLESALAGQLSR
jgi:two-component system chemotaxis response regulator CheY